MNHYFSFSFAVLLLTVGQILVSDTLYSPLIRGGFRGGRAPLWRCKNDIFELISKDPNQIFRQLNCLTFR